MAISFTVTSHEGAFTVCAEGKLLHTPGKHPLQLPSRPLAEAIASEWQASQKYRANAMPLTSLAYTAIDRIHGQQALIVEALMVYVDTDTLCYRSDGAEVARRQEQEWDPVLAWANHRFDVHWAVTKGIMPLAQSPAVHEAMRRWLSALDAMRMAAACVLASGCSSLALMVAVLERHLGAAEAFRLSRLEEDAQAERWGVDEEALARALRLKDELLAAERFLKLLDAG